ncbi:GyrI-like domain-containing protein [Rhizomicrobium electricum]|jgi:AraC family transcriptional regulator|uniref:AraC effector-binding domain-containing protein n=1 Tax=Rhizomicrobium electricum TaxID=480070 RepID=A0ABN1EKS2_9PROT|nr:GyrI-like domain-containing protein [Rhizomicrobium electricum]NIJ47093.1 putative transcriptional regulator YdeE [Rhizomicrobium electricum]
MGISFAPPRLEPFGPVVLAGLQRSHRVDRDRKEIGLDISAQWHALAAVAGSLPVLPPRLGYGVALHTPEGANRFDYFCGFPVDGLIYVPAELVALALPRLTVAVFEHHEHVSLLHSTTELIFATVLPMAEIEPADEDTCPAAFIQRYTERFDPATGLGGVEVLVPVKV